MTMILQEIANAAERGEPCPSNPELCAITGYHYRTISKILQRLVCDEKIEIERNGNWRQVTICATGKKTAGKPPTREREWKPNPKPTVRVIVRLAATVFEISERDIGGQARFGFILRARFAVYAVAHGRGWGMSHIGRAMGRDHSTICHGIRRCGAIVAGDAEYGSKVAELAALAEAEADRTVPQLDVKPAAWFCHETS